MKTKGILLSLEIHERIEKLLESPGCTAKSKKNLVEMALAEYLNREEVIAKKMEAELLRIRREIG